MKSRPTARRIRMIAPAAAALAALLAGAAPAAAHHSATIYDRMRTLTLNGVVRDLQWSNPHGAIDMIATLQNGKPMPWTIEMEGPIVMEREGWSRNSLMPGDRIVARVMPLKDGRSGARLIDITKADGTVLRMFTPRAIEENGAS